MREGGDDIRTSEDDYAGLWSGWRYIITKRREIKAAEVVGGTKKKIS